MAEPVVLFDGVCNVCSRTIRFAVPRDDGTLRFAPLQSDVAADLRREHGLDPDYFDSVVLVEDGEVYTKSDAIVRIAAHLSAPWSLARHLGVVPRPLRDRAYDAFARVRYPLFGRKAECMVSSPELRDRFLARDP